MKIAILNDTHCGVRGASDIFLDNASKFYSETFFPYCKEHNIKKVIHLGDYYDNRNHINFKALYHNRKNFLEPLRDAGIYMDIIPGNHDTYYKNTNTPNSLKELLGFFINNVNIIEEPKTMQYGSLRFGFVPWINQENHDRMMTYIRQCKVDILGGHFEIEGLKMMRGQVCEHGLDQSIFSRFDKVLSGHFHHKNELHNIHYLGAQLEFTWVDSGDAKYFHVLDTETGKIEAIRNPHTLFAKVIYDDHKYDYDRIPSFEGRFVKVVVINNDDKNVYENFIDRLQNQRLLDLTIAENYSDIIIHPDSDSPYIGEDTSTLMGNYIDEVETELDKERLKNDLNDIYIEAQTLELK